jgi:hypothetical protein
VELQTERAPRVSKVDYVYRRMRPAAMGKALAWWLEALQEPNTQKALLVRGSVPTRAK